MDAAVSRKPTKTYVNPNKTPLNTLQRLKDRKPMMLVLKREVLTTKKAMEFLLNGTLKSKVCRFCLYITNPLSELDQIMQIADRGALYKVTIRDIVATVHPFKIASDPNFPDKICEKCLNKAIQSYFFAQQCEQSERALRNCFVDMMEKLNKLDPLDRSKKSGRHKIHPNHNVLYTEHHTVIEYAEPIRHLVNISSIPFTDQPVMSDLECKKCWQVLPNVEALVNHEKIHPKSMWFNCRLCGQSFSKKIHIKRHLRVHAIGRIVTPSVKETSFVCKQCEHSCDDHNIHLQHIEKHKFQTVLEHLVERRMDKLCSVCFDSNKKMIEMDKIICLHGGYPELTGERTVYNILGATVPEPNYKYQELYMLHKPRIIKITKKLNETNQLQPVNTEMEKFELSLPVIVSLQKITITGIKVFEFSAPLKTKLLDIESSVEQISNENNETANNKTKETLMTEIINVHNTENHLNKNEISCTIDVDHKKTDTQYKFSNPDYSIEMKEIPDKSDVQNINDNIIKKCKQCWIFKKPMCKKCTENTKSHSQEQSKDLVNTTAEINTMESKPCHYCWVFKNVGKCDHCKQVITTINFVDTVQKANESKIKHEIKINTEELQNTKETKKRKSYALITSTAKKPKWECNICLTINDTDRDTCLCCQSEKVYEETVRPNLNTKFDTFMKNVISQCEETHAHIQYNITPVSPVPGDREENLDINQNDVNFETNAEEKVKEKPESIVRGEVNYINNNLAVEMMESSNSLSQNYNDLLRSDNSIFKPNTFDVESMDTSSEEMTNVINIHENISVTLPNEERMLGTTPSIQGIISGYVTNACTSNPYPYSIDAIPNQHGTGAYHNVFKNDYKFSMGAMVKEDTTSRTKNFRKTLKKLKATRK